MKYEKDNLKRINFRFLAGVQMIMEKRLTDHIVWPRYLFVYLNRIFHAF